MPPQVSKLLPKGDNCHHSRNKTEKNITMRYYTILLLSLLTLMGEMAYADRLTAFPGAEGYGRFTTGGRGGNVYYVTSLADCTDDNLVEGTLRWALRTGDDTPRTILFNVCGTIYLERDLKFAHSNVTIAGQTAPGGGVCIAGHKFYVCKNNVIIRYIRFRAGDVPDKSCPAIDVENAHNVILDHCSFTWSMEECVTAYDTDSTTIQWSIIGEGLYNSKNQKGARAYATQWGGEHSTMHHCLITNCNNRTPRFNGVRDEADLKNGKHNHDAQVVSEFANNVVFNWGKQNSLYGGENDTTKNRCATGEHALGYDHIYMYDNYFVPGPNTTQNVGSAGSYRFVVPSQLNGYGSWYLDGNKFSVESALNDDNWKSFAAFAPHIDTPQPLALEAYETAEDAWRSVCAEAGANLPRLDEVDARLLAEAAGRQAVQFFGSSSTSGTPDRGVGIINSPSDVVLQNPDTFVVINDSRDTVLCTNYPSLALLDGETLITDTDQDGMPDAWENAHGLNPNDPADGAACTLSSLVGYTNLEYYLNGADGEMAADIPTYVGPVHPEHTEGLVHYWTRPRARKVLTNDQITISTDEKSYDLLGR